MVTRGLEGVGLKASIHRGVGVVNLILPRDVGVRIEADSGLGGVNGEGLSREGDVYANGRTDVTLQIKAEVGVGGVELILGN